MLARTMGRVQGFLGLADSAGACERGHPPMAPITRWRHSPEYLRGVMSRKRVLTWLVHDTGLYRVLDRVWWSNRSIEVTRHVVPAPVERRVRVALIADLHVVRPGPRERRLLELIERERPDAIALNGDFGALGGPPDACGPVLEQLQAPLGVWASLGNWDYGNPVADWRSFLAAHGVRLLLNESAPLVDRLWLLGLDSALVGWPDLDRAFSGVPTDAFVVGLIHCPVLFEDLAGRVPLALAGHTHGGQVLLPGVRPLYMPRGCWPYVSGWYPRDGSRMYVSRGIGCPSLPVRVACPPELAIFEFAPTDKAAEVGLLWPTGPR
jgi:predicted MPP superfamily phosphohydrolase